jgi:nucleoid-associated protein YgaU
MDSQSLDKLPFNLKIVATTREGIPLGVSFVAMFNPESLKIHEDIEWRTNCAEGKQGSDPTYQRTKPRKFSIDFTIDGTGVSTKGVKIPVTAQVILFRAVTTNVRGAIHRSPYLMVQYGTFICNCVLSSSEITYTMFDMYGLPVRAKISATFIERVMEPLGDILGMLSSSDLTHRRVVKEGDLLPLLTYQIYNKQDYYLQVAKVNRLKNFRKLKAGTTLVFPPVSKKNH